MLPRQTKRIRTRQRLGRDAQLLRERHDQLLQLSDEVGPERTLLVVCSAFRGQAGGYPNLTVKKIPKAILQRCEWGHDHYSLRVENLPKAPEPLGQRPLFNEGVE